MVAVLFKQNNTIRISDSSDVVGIALGFVIALDATNCIAVRIGI